jgi:uncharacterized protein YbaP (TraB family)
MTRRALLLAPLLLVRLLPAQTDAPAATKKALFWRASSGNNVVYLLGSVHLGTKSMYPLAREIEEAFDRATAMAVEIDINRVDMRKTEAAILKLGIYPDGETLWKHISPETRKLLEEFCAAYKLDTERFVAMKPWLVTMSMAMVPLLKNGMDLSLGIDKYFLDKAKGKKRIVEIESTEEQFKMFASFPDDVQEKILAGALKDPGDAQAKAKRMENAWIAGDAAEIDRITTEKASAPAEVERAMLQDRNPRMADAAEQLLKSKEIGFVVVGAAHLVGKDGVVAILERRGYRVEQVTLQQ